MPASMTRRSKLPNKLPLGFVAIIDNNLLNHRGSRPQELAKQLLRGYLILQSLAKHIAGRWIFHDSLYLRRDWYVSLC